MSEKLKLWFFRDLTDDQRLKLFSLFHLPTDEIGKVHGRQMIALRHIVAKLVDLVRYERREPDPLISATPAVKAWKQADEESENQAFNTWFKERRYPDYPQHYPLITENAMHAAWQEAAKRSVHVCAARMQGTAGGNDPADCDWPFCGCDKKAEAIIAAITEGGFEISRSARTTLTPTEQSQ